MHLQRGNKFKTGKSFQLKKILNHTLVISINFGQVGIKNINSSLILQKKCQLIVISYYTELFKWKLAPSLYKWHQVIMERLVAGTLQLWFLHKGALNYHLRLSCTTTNFNFKRKQWFTERSFEFNYFASLLLVYLKFIYNKKERIFFQMIICP